MIADSSEVKIGCICTGKDGKPFDRLQASEAASNRRLANQI